MFRYKHNREILWVHMRHIAQDFQNFCDRDNEPDDVKGSAAWQMALCYITGFGVSTDEQKADEYITRANHSGDDVATQLGPMILSSGARHTGEGYTEHLCAMIRRNAETHESNAPSDQGPPAINITGSSLEEAIRIADCSSIMEMHNTFSCQPPQYYSDPPVVQGLRTGNRKVVETLLSCRYSPEEKEKSGRNGFHWLFMLGNDALPFARDFLQSFRGSEGLNIPAFKTINVHPQCPLQLHGTPLAHAIAIGCLPTVQALLYLGANPLAADEAPRSFQDSSEATWNAVHDAVQYHRPEMLRLLLHATKSREPQMPIERNERLAVFALSYSSVVERMAMHGQKHAKNLEETIALLGSPNVLEERAKDGTTTIMEALDRRDLRVTSAILHRNKLIGSRPVYSNSTTDAAAFHYPIHHAAYLTARRDDPDVLEMLKLIMENDPEALS
jgi:hypothetical protein